MSIEELEAKVEAFRRAGLDLLNEVYRATKSDLSMRCSDDWPITLSYSARDSFISAIGCLQAALSEMGKPDPVDCKERDPAKLGGEAV